MQPQPTPQRVSHAIAATLELSPFDGQLQSVVPSSTAVPTGAASPMNM
jgi:hypothetical protein